MQRGPKSMDELKGAVACVALPSFAHFATPHVREVITPSDLIRDPLAVRPALLHEVLPSQHARQPRESPHARALRRGWFSLIYFFKNYLNRFFVVLKCSKIMLTAVP